MRNHKHKRSAAAKARAKARDDKSAVASASRSEKLVAGAIESSSLLTLQKPHLSSLNDFRDSSLDEESVPASQQTVPHNTINGSSSTFPSCCEKILINVAESLSVLSLQEPDDSYLEESISNSSVELLGSSSEESITACPQTVPHNTIDGSSRTSPSCGEKRVAGSVESAAAPTLQDSDDSSSEESITYSPRTVPQNITNGSSSPALSPGSNILIRYSQKCSEIFYIRLDQRGRFWVYPDLGGPFKSVDDIDCSISLFDEIHHAERIVMPKRVPDSSSAKDSSVDRHLIQALLDQYNDESNRAGRRALEVEDVLRKQVFIEKSRWYYHFNFTVNQNVAVKNLFFAEVSHMQGRKVLDVSCCCAIDTDDVDEDFICYGCTNNGHPDMQHPNVTEYSGGRMNINLPFGAAPMWSISADEKKEAVYVRGIGGSLGQDDALCWQHGTIARYDADLWNVDASPRMYVFSS
ncbi:hypothetical protein EJB05_46369 [Eragrostis curvula]|uniref:DUF3615 domain-containing protein n=1 Tax=Eragrostis curvula TaxID=38414 RepID=A0A5J9TMZ2_9POAL|nr:hypothetical protein EJB05_46369 [Eragrostis curvula]